MRQKFRKYVHNSKTNYALIAFIGVFILSPDALILKSINSDAQNMSFFRLFILSIFLFVVILIKNLKKGRKIFDKQSFIPNKVELFCGFIWGISSTAFVFSINNTYAINTLSIISFTSIVASLMAWMLFRQRTPKHTLISALFLCLSLSFLFYSSSNTSSQNLFGDFIALIVVLIQSIYFVVLSNLKGLSVTKIMFTGAVIVSIVTYLIFDVSFLYLWDNLFLFLALGFIVCVSFLLISNSAKFLLPAQSALIMQAEVLFGSLFVFIFVNEIPTKASLITAVIIAAALIFNSVLDIRDKKRKAKITSQPK